MVVGVDMQVFMCMTGGHMPHTCNTCGGMRAAHVSCEHSCIGNGAIVHVKMQCMALQVFVELHKVQHGNACESHA